MYGYDILIQHSSFYHLNFAKSFHPSRRNQFQNFHGPVYKKWSLPNKMEKFLWPPQKFCTVHHVILFPLSLSIQMKPSQKTNCLPDDYIITRAIIYVIYNFIYPCFPLQQQHVIHSFSTNYRMCKPYQTCKPFLCESTSFSF